MTIGLDNFRDPAELHLHNLLIQPFRGGQGDYFDQTAGPG